MIEFKNIKREEVLDLQVLASQIWNDNYKEMIGQEQIDYMLNKMYSKDKLLKEFNENYIWKFIQHKECTIGYFSCRVEEEALFLSKLYLQLEHQGKGYGKVVMNYIVALAIEMNCNRIYLTVNKGNIKAIRFYESFGFSKIDKKVLDIGEGYIMDDYIYEIVINK